MTKASLTSIKNKKTGKIILIGGIVISVCVLYFVYILFAPNISPDGNKKAYLCIPDNSSFDDVVTLLNEQAKVTNTGAFKQVSGLLKYKKIRPGR